MEGVRPRRPRKSRNLIENHTTTMSSILYTVGIFILGMAIGLFFSKWLSVIDGFDSEGFQSIPMQQSVCDSCGDPSPCHCATPKPVVVQQTSSASAQECKQPDMSKYVLKSSIPPCPAMPDMSNYILKSECPPVPDLSKYVLKSSIPKQAPVILDCSKCNKPKGECPPCPRPRCPEVKCPEPQKCPSCPPCPRTNCPPAKVKCKSEEVYDSAPIRPYMAGGLGGLA